METDPVFAELARQYNENMDNIKDDIHEIRLKIDRIDARLESDGNRLTVIETVRAVEAETKIKDKFNFQITLGIVSTLTAIVAILVSHFLR